MDQYTADDIQDLDDRSHVRLRTSMYMGNTNFTSFNMCIFESERISKQAVGFVPAMYRCVIEILDNCVDELTQSKQRTKTIQIQYTEDGKFIISDNGRGIPIEQKTDRDGKMVWVPELVLTRLRAGRNFKNDKQAGVQGMNGIGSSATCFLSSEFTIDVWRDGKHYRQEIFDGAATISDPVIQNTNKKDTKTGTQISFVLDPTVFNNQQIPLDVIRNKAKEIALTNPGFEVIFNGERYAFAKGFDTYFTDLSINRFKIENGNSSIHMIFDEKVSTEEMYTWVNSSYLFDGGIINTQFINAFCDKVIDHLSREAKRLKCEVVKNDVKQGLSIFASFKISDPQYDSQAKTRLTGPSLRTELKEIIDENWKVFVRNHKDWLSSVLDRAVIRCKQENNRKAVKTLQKASTKKIPGLVDATSKIRSECSLLVCEGLSAAASILEVRDPKTIASYPLTGKLNNVYGASVAECLQMGKLSDLLAAIGLVPGQKAIRSSLRYSKLIISSDADVDGGSIMALLVNLFFQFWPELFDSNYEPFVYRLIAPNVVVSKGSKRLHFPTRQAFEDVKDQYKGWTVEYMKGLGSLHKEDWKMMMADISKFTIPFTDDGDLRETLKLIFGPDADRRKIWLSSYE